jgi:hypothetical protein
MISIESPHLHQNIGDYVAHLTTIYIGDNQYAKLCENSYISNYSIVLSNPTGDIQIPDEWQTVTTVEANGELFTLALDDPKTGEFTFNPETRTVRLYSDSPLRSVVFYGQPRLVDWFPSQVLSGMPWIFHAVPVQGNIQVTRSFEQFPTAQFEFETSYSKSQIQNVFTPGLEINLFNIPFRISNLQITELPTGLNPNTLCKVSVSFGSKWENYSNQPCFLREQGRNLLESNKFFEDEECFVERGARNITLKKDLNTEITINRLFNKLGISYSGTSLKPVKIPFDTPKNMTVNPFELLQERLRLGQSFVRYSEVVGVTVRKYRDLPVWTYQESDLRGEISTTYNAISKLNKKALQLSTLNPTFPDYSTFPSTITTPIGRIIPQSAIALGYEYPNSELEGEYIDGMIKDKEREPIKNRIPRYKRKETKIETRIDGDRTADSVLSGVEVIQAMSLCFDIGGQTKTRTIVEEEAGATMSSTDEVWGFVFLGREIYNEALANSGSANPYRGDPYQFWRCIRRVKTTYIYDRNTGYLLYTDISGYNTVRYKQESAESPETVYYTSDDPELSLYLFQQIPVYGKSSRYLKRFPEYSNEEAYQVLKQCNRDGTSSVKVVMNPNFAPPYYAELEHGETIGFIKKRNPNNDGLSALAGDVLEPDYITGEEFGYEVFIQLIPATYKMLTLESNFGSPPTFLRGEQLTPQKWIKFTKKFNAQGPAIANAVEETFSEEGKGDLPMAQRRPPMYELEENSTDSVYNQYLVNKYKFSPRTKYYLQTPGYDYQTSPINGSVSFPLADTFYEALGAARCQLAIENWRTGFSETVTIPANLNIKEGDRFNYFCNGESRQRVVISATTTLAIAGNVGGTKHVTGYTTLNLGIYRLPDLNYTKVPITRESVVVTLVFDDEIGDILDWSRVQNRRNFGL